VCLWPPCLHQRDHSGLAAWSRCLHQRDHSGLAACISETTVVSLLGLAACISETTVASLLASARPRSRCLQGLCVVSLDAPRLSGGAPPPSGRAGGRGRPLFGGRRRPRSRACTHAEPLVRTRTHGVRLSVSYPLQCVCSVHARNTRTQCRSCRPSRPCSLHPIRRPQRHDASNGRAFRAHSEVTVY
jgi:hypothetical protein